MIHAARVSGIILIIFILIFIPIVRFSFILTERLKWAGDEDDEDDYERRRAA